jgi:hypothetical protein
VLDFSFTRICFDFKILAATSDGCVLEMKLGIKFAVDSLLSTKIQVGSVITKVHFTNRVNSTTNSNVMLERPRRNESQVDRVT